MESSKVSTIKRMKERGVFNKYIEYINFPFYKNMVPGTQIDFEFPITVLVGKNGSGKSSSLHALYGSPYWYSCSDFWFSTEVDPIAESGGKNRFFYGYRENGKSEIQEVMKTRMHRGSKTKSDDPDYWETSRGIKKDGMLTTKRRSPVKRNVVYLDFRAEVSAFDKIFHFSKGNRNDKKELLRTRSKYLNRLFNDEPMRFPGRKDEDVGSVRALDKEYLEIIGNILGKEYVSIKVAEHSVFKITGTSIYVKTLISSKYSEANAGSGEVAVIQLVKAIQDAEDYSLVLLDEPEVSIHPGAQEKLKEYLLDSVIKKKIQIVISTHSPILVRDMPNETIKLYKTNVEGKFEVKSDVNYQEAFFDLEDSVLDKKVIFCEDYAARELILCILRGMEKEQYFDVEYNPGGEKTLLTKYVPSFTTQAQLMNKVYLFLDGDMQTDYIFKEENITVTQKVDSKYLKNCVENAYGVVIDVYIDGGDGASREDQKCEAYLKYLRYFNNNIFYLPNHTIPEVIILNGTFAKDNYGHILEQYDDINIENAKEIVINISQDSYGSSNHVEATISHLTYKWSLENSEEKQQLENSLIQIFEKDF